MRVLRDPTQATFKTLDPSAKVRYRTWASARGGAQIGALFNTAHTPCTASTPDTLVDALDHNSGHTYYVCDNKGDDCKKFQSASKNISHEMPKCPNCRTGGQVRLWSEVGENNSELTKKFGDGLADGEGDKRSRAQRKRKQIPNTVRFSNDGGLPRDGQGYRSLQMVEGSSGVGSKALPRKAKGGNDDIRGANPSGRSVRDGTNFGDDKFRCAGGSPQLSTKTVPKAADKPPWACATCTLENKGAATTCGVCGNDKPKPRMQIGLELRRDPQNGDLYSKAEFAKYVDER